MKRLPFHAMPLLLRLLLPLVVLVLLVGSSRTALLWRDEVLLSNVKTDQFVADFERLYGPRISELQALGQLGALQTVLDRGVADYSALARIQWHSQAGDRLLAQAEPTLLKVPGWVKFLQNVDGMPSAMQDNTRSFSLAYQGQARGILTLSLTATPEINRIWQAVRIQMWTVAGVIGVLLLLIPLVLWSSLKGLTQLSRAAMMLPEQPELRIQPTGAREVQQLAKAFNTMAEHLQLALRQSQEQLQETTWVAHHDALTGLPNRPLLADRLHQALLRCERYQETLGLCFIDLDHFKPINDQHGHGVGDEVLKTAAARMQAELRDTDTLARLGGDEFVMLLTSLQQPQEASAIVERVLTSLRQPIDVNGVVVQISGSAGLTLQGPVDTTSGNTLPDADLLLRQADQAMYLAKQAGRDGIRIWESGTSDALTARQQWIQRVGVALANGEFRLFYQPKINLISGEVMGLEALIRWQHPERGLLAPIEFLPHVDNTPVIVDIGNWVMNEALNQMVAWLQAGSCWHVSINVAARQLMHPDFITHLSQALMRCHQVKAHWLTLEILETSALDDLSQVSTTVRDAQSLGVHCSLDDFGTGYSSLSYLKELPVHEIKIDQSFVCHMLEDTGDLALVEGIISLGQVFGRQLVAEGMETPEHGVMLLRLGCQVAQGWAIARPMPGAEVAAWAIRYLPDPLWKQWGGLRWSMDDFPLLVAKYDHLKWVDRVMGALNGQPLGLTADELKQPTHCRFGQWYNGHGRQHYRHLSAYKAIAPVHREVHRLAVEVIRLRDLGQLDQSQAQAQQLLRCKAKMLRSIEHLHHEVLAHATA